ncbi:hemolysin family protein [Niveispirillum sp.]|uniref:hemolysin family protein n=1 Tax=Niveispirillum sp. TaxID=1917217 RepID=UPI001B69662F|nr:hemolysin family protein [Niveispirillum sp.]MBP7338722.1 HlyC/CorC family transporter [Niveispirillum sp.]
MVSLELAAVLFLILLNGFFAMSEMAVVSARKIRLQQMAEEGSRGARTALALQEDPSRFLSTVQIGITLIGVINGAVGGATLAERLAPFLDAIPMLTGYGQTLSIVIVVMTITYLSLIAGELVPKRIALNNAEAIASFAAPIMRYLSRVTAPFVWLLGASTEAMLKLLRVPEKAEQLVTEEEVKSLIAEGTASGVFDPGEKRMIEGVMRLADRTVRSLMTPRPEVMWLDIDDEPDNIKREIREARHSRFPVCRGDFDDVIGVIHTKDLLHRLLQGGSFDLRADVRDALVVHDGTEVMRLLDLFKQSGEQMAIVVDEYGTVEGIATLTDVLEGIAGELPDDGGEDSDIVRREDGSLLIDGMMAVEEVEAHLGLKSLRDEDSGYHTLAGFLLFKLGRIPTAGEYADHDGYRFEVVDMDGRRIDKVLVMPTPEG